VKGGTAGHLKAIESVTPACHDAVTMQIVPVPTVTVPNPAVGGFTTIDFALAAQALAEHCRSLDLQAPDFRSPPQVLGLTRTLRRRADGSATVAVAFKNRPRSSVLADMVEGVVATNELSGVEAARARDDLWSNLSIRLADAA